MQGCVQLSGISIQIVSNKQNCILMAEFASYSAHSFRMALERDQEAKKVFAKDEEVLLEKFNSKKTYVDQLHDQVQFVRIVVVFM